VNVFAAASDPTFFAHLCALQCRTLQFGDSLPSVMCTPCIPQRGFMFSTPVPKRFTHLCSVSLLACVHCSAVQILCSRCSLLPFQWFSQFSKPDRRQWLTFVSTCVRLLQWYAWCNSRWTETVVLLYLSLPHTVLYHKFYLRGWVSGIELESSTTHFLSSQYFDMNDVVLMAHALRLTLPPNKRN